MHSLAREPSPRRDNHHKPHQAVLTPIRCLLVDDHPAIRVGLRELLRAEPGFEVVESLATAEAALAFAERNRVDVAVVDYQLSGHSGLWLCRMLKRLEDPPAVLMYSAFSDHLLAAASVVAQADGLVSKTALGAELCDRIREVDRGATRLPPMPPSFADSMHRRLDQSEQAIYGLLLAGIEIQEIAGTLQLSIDAVDAQMWIMLSKFERSDRLR
ncbi:MAG TPA: response regulator transcription factor [Solirubrobacteraceae bacterium]|jgi:DNA-binding NarL/FixJ family response regulator|nr:response regulator transcription factor [Solirubrobacteraceae bacterium]